MPLVDNAQRGVLIQENGSLDSWLKILEWMPPYQKVFVLKLLELFNEVFIRSSLLKMDANGKAAH